MVDSGWERSRTIPRESSSASRPLRSTCLRGPVPRAPRSFPRRVTESGCGSDIPSSPFYDPSARSEEDFVSSFIDSGVVRADWNLENHRPLGVVVRQESYEWAGGELQH